MDCTVKNEETMVFDCICLKLFRENKLLFVGTLLCCVTGTRIHKLEQWHLRKIMCTLKIFCYNMDHTANSD